MNMMSEVKTNSMFLIGFIFLILLIQGCSTIQLSDDVFDPCAIVSRHPECP